MSNNTVTLGNSTICHEILFNTTTSREIHPTTEFNICPDTYVSFGKYSIQLLLLNISAILLTFLIGYILLLLITTILVIWKRNSGHIIARDPAQLILTMLTGFQFVALFSLRIIIGRKIFPCALYSYCFFVTGPVICLPSICRSLKLYFNYKFNLLKMKFSKESEIQDDSISVHSSSDSMSHNSVKLPNFRILKFYQFMVSHKFIIVTYGGVFIIQTVLWAIVGGIDEIIFSLSGDVKNRKRFFVDPGFFEFRIGCSLTNGILIVILVESVFYIAAEVISLIMCIRSDRDTWSIKKETLIYVIIQSIGISLFVISSFIDIMSILVDYFVPYALFMFGALALETIICVLLPVCYAIRKDLQTQKYNPKDSTLESILKHKKGFKIILDFARRSYCPEAVLCYRDIQRFKDSKKREKKIEIAKYIIENYLTPSSYLELNMPQLEIVKEELSLMVMSCASTVSNDLFDVIENHCLQDLTDLQQRLVNSDKFISSLVRELKEIQKVKESCEETKVEETFSFNVELDLQ